MREMLNMKTWTTIIFFLFLLVSIIGEKIKRRGTDSNNKPTEPLQGVFLLLFVKQFRAVVNYFLYSLLCYFTLKCKSFTVQCSPLSRLSPPSLNYLKGRLATQLVLQLRATSHFKRDPFLGVLGP